MAELNKILAANEEYPSDFHDGNLPIRSSKKVEGTDTDFGLLTFTEEEIKYIIEAD
jgi:hypothetical protein